MKYFAFFASSLILGALSTASAGNSVSVQVNEFRLSFFPELYDVLKGFDRDPSTAKFSFNDARREFCRADSKVASLADGCRLSEGEKKRLQTTARACRESAAPLSRFERLKKEVPGLNDTLSIKRQIEISALPILATKFPVSLMTEENRTDADHIVIKIYYSEIQKALKERADLLADLDGKNLSCMSDGALKEARREIAEQMKKNRVLQQEGTEKASREWAQLKRRRSQLDPLPYPSLTLRERKKLSMFLSAFMWRARGGGLYKKDKSASFATQRLRVRYVYYAYQAIAELNGWKRRAGAVGQYMGLRILRGWKNGHDMGTLDGTRAGDFKALMERGPEQTQDLVKMLRDDGFDHRPMEFAGRQMASCYVFSWDKLVPRTDKKRTQWGVELNNKKPFAPITKGGLGWGELCWGAAFGLGFYESLLSL